MGWPKSELSQRKEIQRTPTEVRKRRGLTVKKTEKFGWGRSEQNQWNLVSWQPNEDKLQDGGSDHLCQKTQRAESNEDQEVAIGLSTLTSHW